MRIIFPIAVAALVAGCGGRASGPVGTACMEADRSAANARLCACVQRAASDHLSGADQRRAAEFFADPDKAQDARGGSAFWSRYRRFSSAAERSCR